MSPKGLLLVSQSKILVAVMDPDHLPRAIPRPISVLGHPSRLVFDETLGVIVVVVEITSESAKQKVLAVLNPETGEEIPISWPQESVSFPPKDDVKGPPSTFSSVDESMLCLCTVTDCEELGSTIVFAGLRNKTTGGGALIISYLSRKNHSENGKPTPDSITCTRRHILEFRRPVYAVAALQSSLLFCMGEEVRFYIYII